MNEKKVFNKFLNIILIVVGIGIVAVAAYWGYDEWNKHRLEKEARAAVDDFDKQLNDLQQPYQDSNDDEVNSDYTNLLPENSNEQPTNNTSNSESSNSTSKSGSSPSSNASKSGKGSYSSGTRRRRTTGRKRQSVNSQYKGFKIVGKIEIPKTKLKYPVLSIATVNSMQVAVGLVSGPGLNEEGNTVIMGHNYKNGTFFSNNDKLTDGDQIFITSADGERVRYIVYNVYSTDPSDFDYAMRRTTGKREITLATCDDDDKYRLIVWAREG